MELQPPTDTACASMPPRAALQRRAGDRVAFWRSVCGCQLAAAAFVIVLLWQAIAAPAWELWDGWAVSRAIGLALLGALAVKAAVLATAGIIVAIGERRAAEAATPAPATTEGQT